MMRSFVIGRVIFAALIVTGVFLAASKKPPQAYPPRPQPYEIVSPPPARNAVYAGRFPGADISQKINAADASLGQRPGEIVAEGGGAIGTQIVINSGHTLRLRAGTYSPTTTAVPILLKSGSKLIGDGWSKTIILETTAPNQWGVVYTYGFNQDQINIDHDIEIRNCQIRGVTPKAFYSAPPAVMVGNCHNCLIDGNFINGTHSIGVAVGARSSPTVYADHCVVSNNYFRRVASQNLAVVNGKNIVFAHNLFLDPSQAGGPFVAVIDAEPNVCPTDNIENIQIVDNYLDAREAAQNQSVGFIAFQQCADRGSGRVSGNIMIAGEPGYVSWGIMLSPTAHDVEIDHNYIKGAANIALILSGPRLNVHDNVIVDSGGGGSVAVHLDHVSDSKVTNNTIVNPTYGISQIAERQGSDRNVIADNYVGSVQIQGRSSRLVANHNQPVPVPPRPRWSAAPQRIRTE